MKVPAIFLVVFAFAASNPAPGQAAQSAPVSTEPIVTSARPGSPNAQNDRFAAGPKRNGAEPGNLGRQRPAKVRLHPATPGVGSRQPGVGGISAPAVRAPAVADSSRAQPAGLRRTAAVPGTPLPDERLKTSPAFTSSLPTQTISNRSPKPTMVGGAPLANWRNPAGLNGTTFKRRP